MSSYKVAIIGGGGAGSAAARFLAQGGHKVTVFERFSLDHDHGSSYGGSRIIRRTYPDSLYTRLMTSAYALWEELEAEAGEELFIRCGGLTFGREDSPVMVRTETSLRENRVGHERLDFEEAAGRFPQFRFDIGESVLFQSDGGYLRASQCVRAQMRLAQSAGAELLERAMVTSLRPRNDGVAAVWEGGEAAFDRVLVTAGPWMAEILPWLKMPIMVTRQYYAHLPADHLEDFAPDRFPVWIDADTNFYGFPHQTDVPGVKLAHHVPGRSFDPNQVLRVVGEDDRLPLLEYACRRLPGLGSPPAYEKTCLYTNTPDENFILDRVPGLPGAFLCSGCSGHGFKFTILFGQILASLAADRPVPHDLTRFQLARFGA